jgi:hypothetical protein
MVFESLDCVFSIVATVNVRWCKLVINSLLGEIIPEVQRGRSPRIIRDWISESNARTISLSPLFVIGTERTMLLS